MQENYSGKRSSAEDINPAVTKYPKLEIDKMFCWGSTTHGELGLGGIEDENIFTPREVNFEKANEIEQSKRRMEVNLTDSAYRIFNCVL